MLKQSSIFATVVAVGALTFSAVSGLVNDDAAVPPAVVQGLAPEVLASEFPQAWEMHRAYAEFRDGPAWHGAFAVGSGGAYGAVSGFADREITRADALAHCAAWADDCRIVAEILPSAPLAYAAPSVSGPQAEALLGLQRAHSGSRAFAVDKRGYWGSAWGFATPSEAQAKAMQECRDAQARGHAPGRPGFACKLVWVSG